MRVAQNHSFRADNLAASRGGQTMFRLAHCVPPCESTNRKGITWVSLPHGRNLPTKFCIF
jgi:hypothetical protein